MSKHYFKKEILSNTLLDRNGVAVSFEEIPGNAGVIRLDSEKDKDLLAELNKIAGSRGLVRIKESEYEELKKKPPLNRVVAKRKEPRLFDPAALQAAKPATAARAQVAAEAVETKSPARAAAAPVESKHYKPKTGRPGKKNK